MNQLLNQSLSFFISKMWVAFILLIYKENGEIYIKNDT